uniref:Reverse transcriptase zinc-binding domain-containing protein n=1 Tax=Anopheles culicifacies TaxID=139723 RepID=A0A182MNQ3_9DIPT
MKARENERENEKLERKEEREVFLKEMAAQRQVLLDFFAKQVTPLPAKATKQQEQEPRQKQQAMPSKSHPVKDFPSAAPTEEWTVVKNRQQLTAEKKYKQNAAKVLASANDAQSKKGKSKRHPKRLIPETIKIAPTGEEAKRSFADIVQDLLEEPSLKHVGDQVQRVRKGRAGEVMLVLQRRKTAAELLPALKEATEGKAQVTSNVPLMTVECLHLDEGASVDEISNALFSERKIEVPVDSIRLRKGWSDGTLRASFKVPIITGKALVENPKIKIRWTRVCSAFRTASYDSCCVVAGMIPLHILILEDARCHNRCRNTGCDFKSARATEREVSLRQWQQEWVASPRGVWTRQLIPEVSTWVLRRFGEVEFFITQLLTGHGFFQAHLADLKLIRESQCPECPEERETPTHVFFECPRFIVVRRRMFELVNTEVTSTNIVAVMLSSRSNWRSIAEAIKTIMSRLQQRRIRVEREDTEAGQGPQQ